MARPPAARRLRTRDAGVRAAPQASLGSPAPPLMGRFHNYFWDSWYSIGLVGTLAFLALVVFTFGVGFQGLRLIRSRTDWAMFCLLAFLGVALVSTALVIRFGTGFLGLGFLGGLALGVTAYAVARGLFPAPPAAVLDATDARGAFLLSALAALAAHMVETGFSFPVSTTALLTWICMGGAVGLTVFRSDREQLKVSPTARRAVRGQKRLMIGCAIAAALTTILLAFPLVGVVAFDPASIRDLLCDSFLRIRSGGELSFQLELVVLPTLLGAAFAFLADEIPAADGCRWRGRFLACVLVAGAAAAL